MVERIQSWFNQTNFKATHCNEVTQRTFDAISRVTGIEPNHLPAINFVGLGRLLIKFSNEVLFLSLYHFSTKVLTINRPNFILILFKLLKCNKNVVLENDQYLWLMILKNIYFLG